MHIRLHLVRFMYINLLLSCCFWLYDNVAAADAETKSGDGGGGADADAATAAAAAAAQASAQIRNQPEAPPKPATVTPEPPPDRTVKKVPATTEAHPEAAARKPLVESDYGNRPRTSEKPIKAKGVAAAASGRRDTSVHAGKVLEAAPAPPHSVNSHSEYISAVPASELNLAANEKRELDSESADQVPNNQLNNNNYNNNDAKTHSVSESEQLEPPKEKQQQQQRQRKKQKEQAKESFPEIITELPTVTVTELPLDRLKNRLESVILEEIQSPTSNKSEEQQKQQQQQEQEEQTLQPLFEAVKEVPQKDEQMPKINDPGGGYDLDGLVASAEALGAAGDDGTGNGTSEEQQTGGVAGVAEGTTNDTMAPKANLTKANEEVPMPVFSEWAQKQMEAEASREQAMELEQQVANNSAQRRNNTGSASGKPSTLKLRSKNYASPDCGAKIIASNGDATNTGAVLTQSSDEYMLSTCGSRIWFVVELCEAIQAQKVELANFELFSSSPKNFTVAVSKRFPTRDWSNVGRFAAEDKRTVQTFELHPHLFGKFVRVDIHSHYSKEHFCPVSLFRVFGTSEFEAFETEIRPSDEMDDFDDDFEQGSSHKGNAGGGGGGGIFQSASDAVISMVKKAAEVLVKPTKALKWSAESLLCRTPTFGSFSCASCNSTLVQRINSLLSCQFQQLQGLLNHSQLRADLLQSGVCQEEYGIGLWSSNQSCGLAKRQSYFLSMLPAEHVGAMCKLLQAEQNNTVEQQLEATPELKPPPEPAQENATAATETSSSSSSQQELIVEESMENQASLEIVTPEAVDSQELPSIGEQSQPSATATAATTNSTPADVNIFNVPAELEELELPVAPTQPTVSSAPVTPTLVESPSDVEATTMAPSSSELPHNAELAIEDSNPANWESLDNLLTTTVASITAGGSAAAAAAAAVAGNGNGNHLGVGVGVGTAGAGAGGIGSNVNLQQKLTNGAQSESVFIRLSNRIKALERNMSLSGQYLEELSRRYKKQVEELQQTLTQQTLTVRSLEDQSRRYIEQEQLYQQQSAELAGEVRALSYQVQACILVIIIVGSFIFLMLVLGTVYYRKLRRQTQQLKEDQPSSQARAAKPKLDRRKSYEQMLNQPSPKQRRPSEEAMLILKDCGDSQHVSGCQELASRQRKISVCYGSNNNIAANMMSGNPNLRASLHRRKGAKHSWHNNSLDTTEMQASAGEQLDTFFDADTLKSLKQQPSSSLSGGMKASKKKSLQQQLALKRQESAPASMMQNELALEEEPTSQSDFDESLMLDDDDLANFIPTSDLAYNEFMPEGPSGYLVLDAVDGKSNGAEQPQLQKQATKKSRRLSSPAFFKSPFSKSKNKGGSFNGFGGIKNSHSVHESTSWEWYRLKRSEKQQQQQPHHHSKQTKSLPNSSLDSSSLSEVNFPLNSNSNSTQNSFRILGEAIRSSGESSSITPNGNGQAGGSSSGSNSGGSTTSSTTKKKQRAFNNLFRKVF